MERQFTQGMTIAPGESVSFPMEILDPDLAELIRRGEVSIDVKAGPDIETSPGQFRKEFIVCVDGKPYQMAVLTYHAKRTWRERLLDKEGILVGCVISNAIYIAVALVQQHGLSHSAFNIGCFLGSVIALIVFRRKRASPAPATQRTHPSPSDPPSEPRS